MNKYIALVALTVTLISCESEDQKGERLAKQYCGSCHVFPDPNLLPKEIWSKNVLPNMAFRMGLLDLMEATKIIPEEDFLTVVGTLPGKPMVTDEEWQSIVNYFEANAPEKLNTSKKDSLHIATLFEPSSYSNEGLPMVTLLKFDSHRDRFFIGSRNGNLAILNKEFESTDFIKLKSPASHLEIDSSNNLILSLMGIMDPNDRALGEIVSINHQGIVSTLIDSLTRPVHFSKADLNSDGQDDYVVCEFGNYTGGLNVYESIGDTLYRKHILSTLPGSRNVILNDFNKDGKLDVLALLTQGDEQIALFINRGNFQFQQRTLLKLPPVYGSSYFEIHDFNKDGKIDILYANGDNSDYSEVLKPYHGIRIFTQNTNGLFIESMFYPMHGASKAMAYDFDNDGDLDIAAVSFFPDFINTPDESFIYLENVNQQFKPNKLRESISGRWLIMELADLEDDGDMDIFLGALDFNNNVPPTLLKMWEEDRQAVLILKNKTLEK
jgi:hypothetical protein